MILRKQIVRLSVSNLESIIDDPIVSDVFCATICRNNNWTNIEQQRSVTRIMFRLLCARVPENAFWIFISSWHVKSNKLNEFAQ